jgi:hypothetical protein
LKLLLPPLRLVWLDPLYCRQPSAIASIDNPSQQTTQGINLGMAHQQSTTDNEPEQARQRLDKVLAESVAASETGIGAGVAVDTEAAGSEVLAAIL